MRHDNSESVQRRVERERASLAKVDAARNVKGSLSSLHHSHGRLRQLVLLVMESFQTSKSPRSVKACCEVTDASPAALCNSSALLLRIRDTATESMHARAQCVTCHRALQICQVSPTLFHQRGQNREYQDVVAPFTKLLL